MCLFHYRYVISNYFFATKQAVSEFFIQFSPHISAYISTDENMAFSNSLLNSFGVNTVSQICNACIKKGASMPPSILEI